MLNDIGNIIISRINSLPFIDKYAGVVKVLSYTDIDENSGKAVKKSFPASCQTTFVDCENDKSRYRDLCPDSKKKSVLYLEDKGVRFKSIDGHKVFYVAQFDLICWLNLPLLGVSECSYSARAVAAIIGKLIGKGVPFQDGIYQRLFIKPVGEQPKSQNPFSKYSYDIEASQLLMYPYDYFVMILEVEFMVDVRCIDEITLEPPINCLTQ